MSGLLGGILPAVYSQADRAKRFIGGLLADPMGRLEQAGGQAKDDLTKLGLLQEQAFSDPRNPMKMQDNAASRQLVDTYLNSVMNFAPVGMTVKGPQAEALEKARKNAVKMLGLPENNTPMDRAKALGFDANIFHGSAKTAPKRIYEDGMYLGTVEPELRDLTHVVAGKGGGEGGALFGSDSAGIARGYAMPNKEQAGAMYPMMVRSQDFAEAGFTKPMPKENTGKWFDELDRFNRSLDRTKNRYFRDQINEATASGKGGVVFRNTEDAAIDAGIVEPSDIYAVVNAPVRSRFAAFDPARINENDLLGRADPLLLGLLGLGAGGAAYYNRDK